MKKQLKEQAKKQVALGLWHNWLEYCWFGYLNEATGGFGTSYIFIAGSLFISAILTKIDVKER